MTQHRDSKRQWAILCYMGPLLEGTQCYHELDDIKNMHCNGLCYFKTQWNKGHRATMDSATQYLCTWDSVIYKGYRVPVKSAKWDSVIYNGHITAMESLPPWSLQEATKASVLKTTQCYRSASIIMHCPLLYPPGWHEKYFSCFVYYKVWLQQVHCYTLNS